MGAISSARAAYGLTAAGTPAGTNVTGANSIGASGNINFPTANIVYSFKVTGAASDVATLTISSGTVAQTTGTPTILDGDGKDFEGVTLGTMATLYAIQIIANGENGYIGLTASNDGIPDCVEFADGTTSGVYLWANPTGLTGTLGTLAIALTDDTNEVTVTVIGKTA